MKPILKRIQKLEQRLPPPPPEPAGPPMHEQLREGLAQAGFFQAEDESLMATLARFIGITERELRRRLQRQAAGLPAEVTSDIRS